MSVAQISRWRPPRSTILSLVVVGAGVAVYASKARSAAADSGEPRKMFTGFGPKTLKLQSSEAVNHNTKKLRFEFPDQNAVSGLTLTSALLTFSWPSGRWVPVIRPYTPVSDLSEPGHIDFLVKKYPNGKQSTHIHSLQPGDSLYFLAPLKGYTWTANKYTHVTLIAGGAGITPIYQLARGILSNPEDKTAITLVFGVNGDEDVLLKKEFDEFTARFGPERFRAVYTVSRPSEGSEHRKGYVNAELLKEVAPRRDDEKVFVCGPPAMEASLCGKGWGGRGVLAELGYRKDQIHRF